MVLDASVLINLSATGIADRLIDAFPSQFEVTDQAYEELERGYAFGHNDILTVSKLIDNGVIKRVSLGRTGRVVYEQLVNGSVVDTLDDGEAATIGYSLENRFVALIDEKKARALCNKKFPSLALAYSTDIFLSSVVSSQIESSLLTEAVLKALLQARMQVPRHHVPAIVELVGHDNARQCTCLPRFARSAIRLV